MIKYGVNLIASDRRYGHLQISALGYLDKYNTEKTISGAASP